MTAKYQCYQEITHQAEAWQQVFDQVTAQQDAIQALWKQYQPDQVFFIGCTSPYYAGMSAAMGWQEQLGIPVRAIPCNELIQFPQSYYPEKANPLLVVLSRSGRTTEAIWAVEEFNRRFPGRTILLSPRAETPLSKLTHLNIFFPEGDDAALPQTRSLSSMLMAALTLGAVICENEKDLELLRQAPPVFASIVAQAEPIIREAVESRRISRVFFLGSGPLYGIAREATLKVMEMSFVSAFCYPFLESRHGPRSLFDPHTLVMGLYSQAGLGLEAAVLEEYTRNFGVNSIAAVPGQEWNSGEVAHIVKTGVVWGDRLQGLAYLPLAQLVAYYIAIQQGVNPDISRNTTSFIEIARA